MHLTLKRETTRPPGSNSLQQQDRFDAFVHEFNTERPHEALGMKCPAQLYTASRRRYDGLPELTYPFHDRDILVTACGRLCLHRKRINISACWPVKSSTRHIWKSLRRLMRCHECRWDSRDWAARQREAVAGVACVCGNVSARSRCKTGRSAGCTPLRDAGWINSDLPICIGDARPIAEMREGESR